MSNLTVYNNSTPIVTDFDTLFDDIMGSIEEELGGASFPRLKLQSGRFIIDRGAEEETLKSLETEVIVLNAIPNLCRKYYAKAYRGDEEATAPDCLSLNGKTPTGGDNRQCESCDKCSHNVYGTARGQDGKLGAGKACSEYKQLAVYHAKTREILGLAIPPTSLKKFGEYLRTLKAHNRTLPKVITILGSDVRKETGNSVFTFEFGGDLGEKEITKVVEMVASDEVKQIVSTVGFVAAPKPEQGKIEVQEEEPKPIAKPAAKPKKEEEPKPIAKPAAKPKKEIPKEPLVKKVDSLFDDEEEVEPEEQAIEPKQKSQAAQDSFFDDDDDELAKELGL